MKEQAKVLVNLFGRRGGFLALILNLTIAPAFAADTILIALNASASSVQSFSAVTGASAGLVASGNGLSGVIGMAIGPDGNLYVSSYLTDQIFKFSPTGTFLDIFISAGSGGLSGPSEIVFGPDGDLYASSSLTNQVLQYDGMTGAFLSAFVAAGSGGLSAPSGLVFSVNTQGGSCAATGQCFLLVGSASTNQVLAYDYGTGAYLSTLVSAGSGGLNSPGGMALGPDGNLYVTSQGTNQVLQYNSTTGVFLSAFVAAGSGGLNSPAGLAFADGNLYVASQGTNQILEYAGTTGAFAGVFAAGLAGTPGQLLLSAAPITANVDIDGVTNCGFSVPGFPAGSWSIPSPASNLKLFLTKQFDTCGESLFQDTARGVHALSAVLTESYAGANVLVATVQDLYYTSYAIAESSSDGVPTESLSFDWDSIEETAYVAPAPPLSGSQPLLSVAGPSTTAVTIDELCSFTTLNWATGVTANYGAGVVKPTGTMVPKITYSDLSIVKAVDSCSAALSEASAAGADFPKVTLTTQTNTGLTLQITATAVHVLGYQVSGASESFDVDFATIQFVINSNSPVLNIGKSHPGNFWKGQQGANYTLVVSNSGGPASGVITVTDNLPTGLTLGSMGGAGWSCSGTSCMRSDPIYGGSNYPSIAVSVNVASGAASPQVNSAAVSGGGAPPATATDSTTISSACDVNQDGAFTVMDVQSMINEALGLTSPANDLSGDGTVNVLDIQIVMNAALDLGCSAR